MAFTFCPFASGSKGNCIFIKTPQTKILIDAGLSAKAIKEHLKVHNTSLEEIDAIFITHEHSDHIAGLQTLSLRYEIPIIANIETAKAIELELADSPKFKIFTTGEPFEFKDLEIDPFSIQHDAVDPVAYTILWQNEKIGICTDIGFATSLVKSKLKNCSLLYVEANHKPSMVHASNRPQSLKTRILGPTGHLSNEDCAELLLQIAHDKIQQVYLAHLSSECNTPEVALTTVKNALSMQGISLPITIAHQHVTSLTTNF